MALPPLKPQLKRLRDVTLNELAYIASPAFALSKLNDKTHRIDGIPAGLQPAQIENGEWVLVCDNPWSRLMSPAFLYYKNLKRWAAHANINGAARIPFQLHITILAPVMINKPRSSGASGTTSKPKRASSPEDYPTDSTSAAIWNTGHYWNATPTTAWMQEVEQRREQLPRTDSDPGSAGRRSDEPDSGPPHHLPHRRVRKPRLQGLHVKPSCSTHRNDKLHRALRVDEAAGSLSA